jgi:hypothetical protein
LPHLSDLVAAILCVNVDSLHLVTDLQSKAQTLFGDAGPSVERDNDERLDKVIDTDGAIDGDLA